MKKPLEPIQMLAIDLDGTLLNQEGEVSARNKEAIQAAQEAGVLVTLATGRRYTSTQVFARELGIQIPLVLYDGTILMSHPDGNILHSFFLKPEVAREAMQIGIKAGLQPIVQRCYSGVAEESWVGEPEKDTPWETDYLNTFPLSIRRSTQQEIMDSLENVVRINYMAPMELLEGLEDQFNLLNCAWYRLPMGNYGSAELAIISSESSKAAGIRVLAEQVGVPMSSVMAIGDNHNDIEMLKAVGWGIAMGQAVEVVKAAAGAVTTSNLEDGVAQAIEDYILQRSITAA